jgi:hypothetical protein
MWFWIGIVIGGAGIFLYSLLRNKNLILTWYEWLLGLAILAAFTAAVQHYFGSMAEHEPRAAWVGALIFAAVGLVFGVIEWLLVARNSRILT